MSRHPPKYECLALWEGSKLICVCLRSNPGCDRDCDKETFSHEQYEDLQECMKAGEVRL